MQDTKLSLCPRDAEIPLSFDAFDDAVRTEGFGYELIEGGFQGSMGGHARLTSK